MRGKTTNFLLTIWCLVHKKRKLGSVGSAYFLLDGMSNMSLVFFRGVKIKMKKA